MTIIAFAGVDDMDAAYGTYATPTNPLGATSVMPVAPPRRPPVFRYQPSLSGFGIKVPAVPINADYLRKQAEAIGATVGKSAATAAVPVVNQQIVPVIRKEAQAIIKQTEADVDKRLEETKKQATAALAVGAVVVLGGVFLIVKYAK